MLRNCLLESNFWSQFLHNFHIVFVLWVRVVHAEPIFGPNMHPQRGTAINMKRAASYFFISYNIYN
ncbi:hypothetical protein YYC_02796 [Plasmodium yoelii 17X]|uniref:Uncharacterized protein n=2 Tax=Plasmodium yoelii TaxID=5861 RepID=Q7RLM2_PLAYO|nr:hypothetical protein [Plasmodium yoelii yoelii]ETB60531.1 hypothetical protein YYC_02796 [Plasmodium yoelii 17X]